MAVVIRLQGLRVTAGTEDIRKFFTGLKIPDGGVHIIGGEREEAFIIFASDEDARRAMTRSGDCIKDAPVALLLSSKAEMQDILERSSKDAELDQRKHFEENARHSRRSLGPEMGRRSESRSGHTPPPKNQMASDGDDDHSCVFLKGLPFAVTEEEVYDFFSGLLTDEVILLKRDDGSNNGRGLVKFATREDANEALKRDRNYIGSRYIEVSMTTLNDWQRSTGRLPRLVNRNSNFERDRSPIRNQRNPHNPARSQSPFAQGFTGSRDEYCVFVDNLSYSTQKEDIKKLLQPIKLEDDQILHLIGREGRRTRSAFVLFRNQRDYCDALAQEKRLFFNRWVQTRPISRENMLALIESNAMDAQSPGNSQRFQDSPAPIDRDDSEKACVYVRNLPLDVRKVEIMDLFFGFNITEDTVYLLLDHKGAGMGKALVLFRSEAEASRALSLNGQRFLGSEVILKCISRPQMRQLGVDPPMVREPLARDEWYHGGGGGEASYRCHDTEYPDFRRPRDGYMSNIQDQNHGNMDNDPYAFDSCAPQNRGNGVHDNYGPPSQPFEGPTCIKFLNLPFKIKCEEIYDFCYGYNIIPGSVSLKFVQGGKPTTATVVFASRAEALTAVEELNGRPIGARKVKLLFV